VWTFSEGQYEGDKDVLKEKLASSNGVLTKIVETDEYCVQLEIHDTEEGEVYVLIVVRL
jgi:hypothetical protein